jgi:hypothetical protein
LGLFPVADRPDLVLLSYRTYSPASVLSLCKATNRQQRESVASGLAPPSTEPTSRT